MRQQNYEGSKKHGRRKKDRNSKAICQFKWMKFQVPSTIRRQDGMKKTKSDNIIILTTYAIEKITET